MVSCMGQLAVWCTSRGTLSTFAGPRQMDKVDGQCGCRPPPTLSALLRLSPAPVRIIFAQPACLPRSSEMGSFVFHVEAPPIVGGKGLRQWQVSQRKAFLNGWSMMDRLTHLESENAQLRKENDLLRKVRRVPGILNLVVSLCRFFGAMVVRRVS